MPNNRLPAFWFLPVFMTGLTVTANVVSAEDKSTDPPYAPFAWSMTQPLVSARNTGGLPWHAIKDPSIVRHNERWHLFATMRGTERSHTIVYLSFEDWDRAEEAERSLLTCHDGFFCAPQVFWFEPHRRWYLICQAANEEWGDPPYRPAFATTDTIYDPASWTALKPLFDHKPVNIKSWLDFWVICDEDRAWLFFTSLNGQMWRSSTSLTQFPVGWSRPELALQADVFEASHTYRITGQDRYLTLIEAQNGHGFRYFKAYVADSLDGEWQPLAATKDNAFASLQNVMQASPKWTDAISHGELLRAGNNQRLEVDPSGLQMIFQGATNAQRRGKSYGDIPWRLGILTQQSD